MYYPKTPTIYHNLVNSPHTAPISIPKILRIHTNPVLRIEPCRRRESPLTRGILTISVRKRLQLVHAQWPVAEVNLHKREGAVHLRIVNELDAFSALDLGALTILDAVAFAPLVVVHADIGPVTALFEGGEGLVGGGMRESASAQDGSEEDGFKLHGYCLR